MQSNSTQAARYIFSSHQRSPLNLTKKRKFLERSSNSVNTPNENNEPKENCSAIVHMSTSVEELQIPSTQEPLTQYDNIMQTNENIENDQIEERAEENSPDNQDDNLDPKFCNWWQMSCQIQCFTCIADLLVEESTDRITCTECGEGQYVARPCCVEPSSNQRFAYKLLERYVECPVCKSNVVRLPCCNPFQPEMKVDKNLFECVQCAKYSIACICATLYDLPPKSIGWDCSNFNCN